MVNQIIISSCEELYNGRHCLCVQWVKTDGVVSSVTTHAAVTVCLVIPSLSLSMCAVC